MPKEKRSVAQALLYSGQQLGTIVALLIAPKVVHPQETQSNPLTIYINHSSPRQRSFTLNKTNKTFS
jgi:hypothetical protein